MPLHVLKLTIHATPGAKRTQAAGSHGAALRVRLGAPPVDGKANAALVAWAAEAFDLPRARIELLHGVSGRQKLLALSFDNATALAAARAKVGWWMAAGGDEMTPE